MSNPNNFKPGIAKVNHPVFWTSAIICLIFYAPLVIYQEAAQGIVNKLMDMFTYNIDWLWEVIFLGAFLFSIGLALSRYGNIKLGGKDDKPEFSNFTWIVTMFCGGVGCGLVYWTFVEPLSYLMAPPFGIEPMTADAAQFSLAYGIFHWGPLAFGFYMIPAITFAYSYHVRKKPYMYPSYACRGALGKYAEGWLGKVIDTVVIVGLVGGVGTALGVCVPMISAVVSNYFGVPDNMTLKFIITLLWSCIFGYSCYKGLYSGIAKLSEINAYACIVLVIFVLIAGPTSFMLSNFADNIGALIHNFDRMTLYTDPVAKSGFPQGWTVFYWAWWAAWTIYMGLFIARISKGRTIRQVTLGTICAGTAGCALFFLVFGNFTIDLVLNKGVPLPDIMAQHSGEYMVAKAVELIPLAKIITPLFILVMFIFQATSIDSNAYTMAMIGCKEIKGTDEPPRWARAFWALMVMFVVIALMLVGGIQVVQLSSVLTSIPVLFIVIILAISLVKWIKEDFGHVYSTQTLVAEYDAKTGEKISVTTSSSSENVTV